MLPFLLVINLIILLCLQLAQLELSGDVSKSNNVPLLKQQNAALKTDLESWKKKLVDVGVGHGIRNFSTTASISSEANNQPAGKSDVKETEVKVKNKEAKKVQPKKGKFSSI